MEMFEKDKVARCLANVPSWKRLAFMALVCERMIPNFERFSAETAFGDPRVLRHALDAAWTFIRTATVENNLEELKLACEKQAPDTEQFGSVFTSSALDAANAISTLLDAISDDTVELAVDVAELARDTVDMFVQRTEAPDPASVSLEHAILAHPLMQRELAHQRQDLSTVLRWPESVRSNLRPTEEQRGSLD
jgi:uncharacterized protein YjaG (DUF416 family)